MNIRILIAALITMGTGLMAFADRDEARAVKAVSNSTGSHFMLIVPVSDRRENWMWTTYRVEGNGVFREAWHSDGIYARQIFLGDDGQHVACVESWPSGHSYQTDVVVALYREGELLKTFKTLDLVRDPDALRSSVSHYRWLADRPSLICHANILYFTTIDGLSYTLNMRTGELSSEP